LGRRVRNRYQAQTHDLALSGLSSGSWSAERDVYIAVMSNLSRQLSTPHRGGLAGTDPSTSLSARASQPTHLVFRAGRGGAAANGGVRDQGLTAINTLHGPSRALRPGYSVYAILTRVLTLVTRGRTTILEMGLRSLSSSGSAADVGGGAGPDAFPEEIVSPL
jgi:hypothetical protein